MMKPPRQNKSPANFHHAQPPNHHMAYCITKNAYAAIGSTENLKEPLKN